MPRQDWLSNEPQAKQQQKEKVTMTASAAVNTPKQSHAPQLQKLREVYAGASELGRVALEKIMPELEAAVRWGPKATINGRIGIRQGKVSEFTLMFKLVPGGAD